jgi:hypothetical protein
LSRQEQAKPDSDLPEITESDEPNPGWQIRVGVSRRVIQILEEADANDIWFDTQEEMDAYIRRKLAEGLPSRVDDWPVQR